MLLLSSVLRRFKNFTSSGAIRMPPGPSLLIMASGSKNPQNRTGVLFHYPSCGIQRRRAACFERSGHPVMGIRGAPGGRVRDRRWLTLRTASPFPRSNYELFNCSNFNIRYWSWNYRGCWHQTCPAMGPRPWV